MVACHTLARLYGASRLFVNFFQPSFKLADKHREGAHVSKRYHPPQTPCERLLQSDSLSEPIKRKLREVENALDPLQLLEEVRDVESSGGSRGRRENRCTRRRTELSEFLASLSGAWRAEDPTNSPDGIKAALSAADPKRNSSRHWQRTSGRWTTTACCGAAYREHESY
jgi:hypothetical protein